MSIWKLCCGAPPIEHSLQQPWVRNRTARRNDEIQPDPPIASDRRENLKAYSMVLHRRVRDGSEGEVNALLHDPLLRDLPLADLRVIYQHANSDNRFAMRHHDALSERAKAHLFTFELNTIVAQTWERSSFERVLRKRPQQHTLLTNWAREEATMLRQDLGDFHRSKAHRLQLLLKHPILRWIDTQTLSEAYQNADVRYQAVFEKYLPPNLRET